MRNSLVVRWGLAAVCAGAALPLVARAQTPPPVLTPPTAAAEETPPGVIREPVAPPVAPAEPMAPALLPAEPVQPTEVTPPPEAPAAEAPALAPPTINGFVEAGYSIHFSDPKVSSPVPMRVYDPPGNSFTLHAAHLALTQKFSDAISAVVEVDVGRDAAVNGGLGGAQKAYPWATETQFAFDIQEAYANYAAGGFTLSAGKFVTYEGIEVIEGPLNPTITRGFLFGYAEPFTHTGLKLHYQPVDELNIGVGVVNGWDLIGDNNQGKTVIARIAVTPSDKFFAALSGSIGPEQTGNSKDQRLSIDLTGAITPSGSFQLWYQANVGSEKVTLGESKTTAVWYGFGLQPVVTSGDFTLGGRLEYFADEKGVRTLTPKGKFFNVTITPGIKIVQVFKVRAEFRADIASDKVLGKVKEGDGKKVGLTAALSAEYTF